MEMNNKLLPTHINARTTRNAPQFESSFSQDLRQNHSALMFTTLRLVNQRAKLPLGRRWIGTMFNLSIRFTPAEDCLSNKLLWYARDSSNYRFIRSNSECCGAKQS